MPFIFYDTETSGFPSPKKHAKDQAWICQLAAVVTDDTGAVMQSFNELVKANGRYMAPGAAAVHGFTAEILDELGKDEVSVASQFAYFMEWCDSEIGDIHAVVAHNLDFDSQLISAMLSRAKVWNPLLIYPQYCTMKHSVDLCRLPFARGGSRGTQRFKWPKLEELHTILFGNGFEGAHNALSDVVATANCFFDPRMLTIYDAYMKGK